MTRLKRLIEEEYDAAMPADFEKKMLGRIAQRISPVATEHRKEDSLLFDFLIALVISILFYMITSKVRYIEIDIPVFNASAVAKNSSLILVFILLTIVLLEEKFYKIKKTFFI